MADSTCCPDRFSWRSIITQPLKASQALQRLPYFCLVGTEWGGRGKAPHELRGREVVRRSAWEPAELKGASALWESGTIVAWSFQRQHNMLNCHLTSWPVLHLALTNKTHRLIMLRSLLSHRVKFMGLVKLVYEHIPQCSECFYLHSLWAPVGNDHRNDVKQTVTSTDTVNRISCHDQRFSRWNLNVDSDEEIAAETKLCVTFFHHQNLPHKINSQWPYLRHRCV